MLGCLGHISVCFCVLCVFYSRCFKVPSPESNVVMPDRVCQIIATCVQEENDDEVVVFFCSCVYLFFRTRATSSTSVGLYSLLFLFLFLIMYFFRMMTDGKESTTKISTNERTTRRASI